MNWGGRSLRFAVALGLVAAALSWWFATHTRPMSDEGAVLTAAAKLLRGGVFYRDVDAYWFPGSAYLAAFKSEESLRTLERALLQQPTVRLWSLLGDQHYIDENYAESHAAYQKCVELDPEFGRAYLMMGYCALELGNLTDAINQLEKAARYPDQAETAAALLARARRLAASG